MTASILIRKQVDE